MYCYCLFCETQKCNEIVLAARVLTRGQAISPKKVMHVRKKGEWKDEIHDLLPGYVFLYLEEEPLRREDLWKIDGFLRCLRTPEGAYELEGSNEAFARMILQKDGVIGKTRVYQEGERIRIAKGAFQGVESRILKVDRRNGRMLIEIPFNHRQVQTWVEYEVVAEDEELLMPEEKQGEEK